MKLASSKIRNLAAQYQSPGASGIGFAFLASTGKVKAVTWDNIEATEYQAENNRPGTEEWAEDMAKLRKLLDAEGFTEDLSKLQDEVRHILAALPNVPEERVYYRADHKAAIIEIYGTGADSMICVSLDSDGEIHTDSGEITWSTGYEI